MKILKNLLVIFSGIVCIVASFASFSITKTCAEKNASLLAESTLDAYAMSIKERILSAKGQMQILAKNTELSKMKRINSIYKHILNYEFYWKSILFSSDIDSLLIVFNEYVNDCYDKLDSLKDVPKAFERLFDYAITFGKSLDDEEDAEDELKYKIKHSTFSFDGLNYYTNFLQLYKTLVSTFMENFFGGIKQIAAFGGNIGLFQNSVPLEPVRCASIISLSMDSGTIAKIILRNEDSDIVLSVGTEKILSISNDDLKKVIKGSNFSIGGIVFSDSGVPHIQITIPVRDLNYRNIFYMTGFINISDILYNSNKNLKISIQDSNGNCAGDIINTNNEFKEKLLTLSSSLSYLDEKNNKSAFIVGKGFKYGFDNLFNEFFIFIELSLFIYLNDWYILIVIVLFLTGVTLILYGGFALATISRCKS